MGAKIQVLFKKSSIVRTIIKFLLIFGVAATSLFLVACDRDLKEHKVPPAIVKKMERKNDPKHLKLSVEGSVMLDPKAVKSVSEQAVLFLYARERGVEGGPPLAAKRIGVYQFPMEYSLGPADVMLEGMEFEGPLTITARLDMDGKAKSAPGDVLGTIEVEPGNKQADIFLDQLVKPSGKQITGTITVAEALKKNLPEKTVMFLLARPEGVTRGAPMAVQRVLDAQFPYTFAIGQADAMIPDMPFEGAVTLIVRLDNDNNLKSTPGDMEGQLNATAGDNGVTIHIDKMVGG